NPFICQTTALPAWFRQTRSCLPSPLKSAAQEMLVTANCVATASRHEKYFSMRKNPFGPWLIICERPARPAALTVARRDDRCLHSPLAAKRLFEFRNDLEQVADEAEIGDLEDRRFAVLVDRHDRAGVLDAGQMLDRAGDADSDVQFGRDDLAGLSDLKIARHVAGV